MKNTHLLWLLRHHSSILFVRKHFNQKTRFDIFEKPEQEPMSNEYFIQTERLGLRPLSFSDLDALSEINGDKEVMHYFPSTVDRNGTKNQIQRSVDSFRERGYCRYAMILLSTNEFIGFTGLAYATFDTHFNPAVEIGWRANKNFWGQGFATEAASAVLVHAFKVLELETIYSFTSIHNKASERIMQKIGMTKIGEFGHPRVEVDHKLHQHVLYRAQSSMIEK